MSSLFSSYGLKFDSRSVVEYCTQYNMGVLDPSVIQAIYVYANDMLDSPFASSLNDVLDLFEPTGFAVNKVQRVKNLYDATFGTVSLTQPSQEVLDEIDQLFDNHFTGDKWDTNRQTPQQCRFWYLLLNTLLTFLPESLDEGQLSPAVLGNGYVGFDGDNGDFVAESGVGGKVKYLFVNGDGKVLLGIKGEVRLFNIVLDGTESIALNKVMYNEGLDISMYASNNGNYPEFQDEVSVGVKFLGSF